MNRLHTVLTRARAGRAHRREERALRRAVAGAPTRESAHELTSLLTRR